MSQTNTQDAISTGAAPRPNHASSPFRSAVGNARRRRAPDVERSTFVICRVQDVLLAFPVEQVERVVPRRDTNTQAAIMSMPTLTLPERRSAAHEVCTLHPHAQALPRTLVLHTEGQRLQLDVSHVYEVRAIETARIAGAGDDAPWAFVVGQFTRDDEPCWVLDVPRLLRAAEPARA